MTLQGKLTLKRTVLIPADKESLRALKELKNTSCVVPLDEALGIDILPFKISPGLMLECAFWAQNQKSYEAAEAMLARVTGIRINDDTIRMVVNKIGKLVFDEDCRRVDETMEKHRKCELKFPCKRKGTLYIEIDCYVLNTKRKNSEGTTWIENKQGIVFSSDNIKYIRNKKTNELDYKIYKKEYITYIGGVDEFKRHLFHCAVKNGYGQYENTVILSDGAPWIVNMSSELFCDAIHIIDFFHICKNVYLYAKEKFNFDEIKYEAWAKKIIKLLKYGKVYDVIEELKKDEQIKDIRCVNLLHYLELHINNINYHNYIKRGLFIGSGANESGNKVVLQSRLKQAGMRWEAKTAQYLLTLRAKNESGLWESEVDELVRRTYDVAMRRRQ